MQGWYTGQIMVKYWSNTSQILVSCWSWRSRYGDIYPVTHEERIFVVFVALCGAVVFSFCMGNVAALISQALSLYCIILCYIYIYI